MLCIGQATQYRIKDIVHLKPKHHTMLHPRTLSYAAPMHANANTDITPRSRSLANDDRLEFPAKGRVIASLYRHVPFAPGAKLARSLTTP